MRADNIRIESAPARGRVRLAADVTYADGVTETYWFEVSASYESALTLSANPWLVALAPLAATLGEPLQVEASADRLLLANVEELLRVWKCWHRGIHIVPVEAEVGVASAGARTGAFFSGGVDAFFTVLRHDDPEHLRLPRPVDDLLTVWGFDVPLDKPEEFERMRASFSEAADQLGKVHIDVATNLRTTRWRRAAWGALAHGCGLGSVALAMEQRFGAVMIGSSAGYERMYAWGSHPVTDPLMSSSGTEVIHDGPSYNRLQKVTYIATNEVVRGALHVCYKHGTARNCSRCPKCYRTMIALHLLGELDKFTTFADRFDEASVEQLYLKNHIEVANILMLQRLARENGFSELSSSMDRSIARSKRLNYVLPTLDRLRHTRVGRWSDRVRDLVMRDRIA